jgi:hypothetical protein
MPCSEQFMTTHPDTEGENSAAPFRAKVPARDTIPNVKDAVIVEGSSPSMVQFEIEGATTAVHGGTAEGLLDTFMTIAPRNVAVPALTPKVQFEMFGMIVALGAPTPGGVASIQMWPAELGKLMDRRPVKAQALMVGESVPPPPAPKFSSIWIAR